MRGKPSALFVTLTSDDRCILESWQRSTTIARGLQRRAHIVLLLDAHMPIMHIAHRVGISKRHVYKWVRRWQAERFPGLQSRQGRPRRKQVPSAA